MEHVWHVVHFAAEVALVVLAIIVVMGFFFYFLQRGKTRRAIEIEDLNEKIETMSHALRAKTRTKKELKAEYKAEKKRRKAEKSTRKHLYVIDFAGDVKATGIESLREEITTVILAAKPGDEVLVRLESPGGMVHSYGLAAAQLVRLREKQIRLTIAVDKVAASGGYMMACVADRIIAAPFAIVGSIGVLAAVPNFSKLLKKHDVEYREFTAGDYKRTVSVLAENTPQGIAKFTEQLQETHVLFKTFIQQYRPNFDVTKLATGEHWYGTQALELKLVDELKTSDTYLLERAQIADVFKITYLTKKKLSEKLAEAVGRAVVDVWTRVQQEILSESRT